MRKSCCGHSEVLLTDKFRSNKQIALEDGVNSKLLWGKASRADDSRLREL